MGGASRPAGAVATRLRAEHLDEPFGITEPRPRLSWQLPAEARGQLAYRIRAGNRDSGRIESAGSLLVPWPGAGLRSRERVSWQVKVWTDAGECDWSEPAWLEAGLLGPADWTAQWIEPASEPELPPAGQRPAWLFRHEVTIDRPVTSARAYVTAHGLYELFINGRRIGDYELTPGFSAYRSRLYVQAYDVTSALRPGLNTIGAVLSDGWFRGQAGIFRDANCFGTTLALLAQLHADHPGGSVTVTGTGPGWEHATAHITAADLIQGQRTDFRLLDPAWCRPGGGGGRWAGVTVASHDLARLTSAPGPPVRRVAELRPVSVRSPAPDRDVADFGQNINGWVRLRRTGPVGSQVVLVHGEALGADGDVTQDNFSTEFIPISVAPFQIDEVISAGEPGYQFEPRHATHGFRYVSVRRDPDRLALSPDEITAVVVHTDLRRTGEFRCSDERVNRLHDAAVWSLRGNACAIPTDCPTRERSGWTGDWQLYVPTAAFLYDVAGFSVGWLRDLAADQWPDGTVPNVIPDPLGPATRTHPLLQYVQGSAGWCDAAVIVPWELYRAYGDRQVLEQQWPSMTAWVAYAARAAAGGRNPGRAAARPEPAPHEACLWDTGFHWGEWLEPGGTEDLGNLLDGDHSDVATAYLHYSARLTAAVARVLHLDHDADRYDDLARGALQAWQAEFLRPDGAISPDTQANHVRALAFGLVPDELRPAAAARLAELVRSAGTHLRTGFLATPYLLPVLADAGYPGLAYELLLQDTPPSWLAMIARGATTIWESWEGIDADGRPHESLNHYSKGAVISFLHTRVAGLRLLDNHPGYRRFAVRPLPGGGLTWAKAAVESPYGRIESGWRLAGTKFTLDILVPPGTTAEVTLPDGRYAEVPPGRACLEGSVTAMAVPHA
jgi:alpha-L-rhamnosidase